MEREYIAGEPQRYEIGGRVLSLSHGIGKTVKAWQTSC